MSVLYFEQFRDPDKGCLSYIIGDVGTGEALVVDPLEALGVETYVMATAERGLAITAVVDTHIHADHVSIGPELAKASGSPYHLAQGAQTQIPFTPLNPGDTLNFGSIQAEIMATPGHTPESLSLLVRDGARHGEPWFVLTGDSLFVGDVGRPDLLLAGQADSAEARAKALFHTVTDIFMGLPDWVEIYPGHYGASTCGGQNMSGKTNSTIGFERRFNLAIKQTSEKDFVDFVMATLKVLPDRYQDIKRQNMGEVVPHA